ncbi:DUF6538 domain-containing protein [uncultured Tateyamaria sp.]|uniref:DUF6538 domain-containing protein n=1 Tax=uncultured Tateyamaria sp. TaxID=455651 RepID=UPI002612679A|nr:DUF6538 domain-containing protein [uncultured Tateyamaria sp.]
MLLKHDRYFYQRKVPLDLQPVVGFKKWRAPLGKDLDEAYDKLRDLKQQHDALINELVDAETRQDFKTKNRRQREEAQYHAEAQSDRAYDEWRRSQGLKTVDEEFKNTFPEYAGSPWRLARELVAGIEADRSRHLPPSANEVEDMRRVFDKISSLPRSQKPDRIKLPPYVVFKELAAELPEDVQSLIRFEERSPDPMDNDECFDRLTVVDLLPLESAILG